MITWLSALIGLFALISLGGGVEAFIAKGSVMSLVGGGGTAVLMFVGLYLARTKPAIGYGITAVCTLALVGMMLPKFLKPDGVLWPHGIIGIGGVVVLVAHVVAHFIKKS